MRPFQNTLTTDFHSSFNPLSLSILEQLPEDGNVNIRNENETTGEGMRGGKSEGDGREGLKNSSETGKVVGYRSQPNECDTGEENDSCTTITPSSSGTLVGEQGTSTLTDVSLNSTLCQIQAVEKDEIDGGDDRKDDIIHPTIPGCSDLEDQERRWSVSTLSWDSKDRSDSLRTAAKTADDISKEPIAMTMSHDVGIRQEAISHDLGTDGGGTSDNTMLYSGEEICKVVRNEIKNVLQVQINVYVGGGGGGGGGGGKARY